jgi:predicted GIY-YIG superfamily endonuclease
MIQSTSSGRHYYGHTSDLDKRIVSHNSTQNKYTSGKSPWIIKGFVKCQTKSEAAQIELKLKRMKNPSRALKWLSKNGSVR